MQRVKEKVREWKVLFLSGAFNQLLLDFFFFNVRLQTLLLQLMTKFDKNVLNALFAQAKDTSESSCLSSFLCLKYKVKRAVASTEIKSILGYVIKWNMVEK